MGCDARKNLNRGRGREIRGGHCDVRIFSTDETAATYIVYYNIYIYIYIYIYIFVRLACQIMQNVFTAVFTNTDLLISKE